MSNSIEVRVAQTRFTIIAFGALSMFASTESLTAQTLEPGKSNIELRVSSGAFIGAGDQRNFLKDANATAAQVSWMIHPAIALTGTFAWARSRDLASVGAPKLDVFTSDVGFEVRAPVWFASHKVTFAPFVGTGGGVRSYNYRNLDVDATNNLAAYGSVGGEVGVGRVGVRIEARDYATGYKPLTVAGKSELRNDVVIMAAVRFNRHAVQR